MPDAKVAATQPVVLVHDSAQLARSLAPDDELGPERSPPSKSVPSQTPYTSPLLAVCVDLGANPSAHTPVIDALVVVLLRVAVLNVVEVMLLDEERMDEATLDDETTDEVTLGDTI